MRFLTVVFALCFAFSVILGLSGRASAQAQTERWISVRIVNVEEAVPDSKNKPSFRITAQVEMTGCLRATVNLQASAQVEGKQRTWTASNNFNAPHQGRLKQNVQIMVAEASLRNPSVGVPIQFAVTARGYYKVKELQQVEYIEYVPVQHNTPGYYQPNVGNFFE